MTLDEIRNADEMTLRNRLAELRGIKRTRKLSPDEVEEGQVRAAANKMMEFDPGAAIGWMQRADQLKSKRVEQTPEAVRFKIQSALNANNQELSAYVQRNGASPTDTGYTDRVKLINALKKELTSDTPSLQRAYLVAQGVEPPADNAPTGGEVPDYNSLVAELNAAKKLGYAEKVKALDLIATKIPTVKLSGDQSAALTQAINTAKKEGAPKGIPAESKESFAAFKNGNEKNLATVAAGLALGDSMKGILEGYGPNDKLTVDDSQKLAALYYQTYNPGTLVAGEMSSAVNSLKNPDASELKSAWNKLRTETGLSDDRLSQPVAIRTYNKGLATGSSAYARVQEALKAYKSKKASDYALTDTYLTGFTDPRKYMLGGSGNGNPPPSAADLLSGLQGK